MPINLLPLVSPEMSVSPGAVIRNRLWHGLNRSLAGACLLLCFSGPVSAYEECGAASAGGTILCTGDGVPADDNNPYPDGIHYVTDGLDLRVGGAATQVAPAAGVSGISVTGTGAGDVTITTAPTVGVTVSGKDISGIKAANSSGAGSAAAVSGGEITTTGELGHGVASSTGSEVMASGTGNAVARMIGGQISTLGVSAYGVFARQFGLGAAQGNLDAGAIATSGRSGHGLVGWISNLANTSTLGLAMSDGTISTTGDDAAGISARHDGSGASDFTLSGGNITTTGIWAHGVQTIAANSGNARTIRLTGSGGTITTAGDQADAFSARHEGVGDIQVAQSDSKLRTDGTAARGIAATAENLTSNGDIFIDISGGYVETKGDEAHAVIGLHRGIGSVRIRQRDGALSTAGDRAHGLAAHSVNGTATADAAAVTEGGSITTSGLSSHGILTLSESAGRATSAISGGAISTSGQEAHGLLAESNGTGAAEGRIEGGAVTTGGTSSHGVLALAKGAGSATATASAGTVATTGDWSQGVLAESNGNGSALASIKGGRVLTTGVGAAGVRALASDMSGTGAVETIATGGKVTTRGDGASALVATHSGLGEARIQMSGGGVATAGMAGLGLLARIDNTASTAQAGVAVSGGLITTDGAESQGVLALTNGSGGALVTMQGGGVETADKWSDAIVARNDGAGAAEVQVNGTSVVTKGGGAAGVRSFVSNSFGTGAAKTLTTGVSIATNGDYARAIVAAQSGLGEARIDMSGDTIATSGAGAEGVFLHIANSSNTAAATLSSSNGQVATTGLGAHGAYVAHAGTGSVAVDIDGGSLAASGAGADGLRIDAAHANATVDLAGRVMGGSGSGAGIRTNSATGNKARFTLRRGTDLSAASGIALTDSDGDATVTIKDGARVRGEITLGGGNDRIIIGNTDTGGLTRLDGGGATQGSQNERDIIVFQGGRHDMGGEQLLGWERLELEGGRLSLTGSTAFDSADVAGGELSVDGVIDSALNIGADGTLSGNGTVSGPVTVAGRLAAGDRAGPLRLGALTLGAGSTSTFKLATPGVISSNGLGDSMANTHVVIDGDLTLGGTLDARVRSAGYFRLFDYDGELSGAFNSRNVTATGFSPADTEVQTAIAGQVNLAVRGEGQTLQFWDGGDMTGNGKIDGGGGAWTADNTNWTGAPGAAAINGPWVGSVGVFGGTSGGIVNVSGTRAFDTLQFNTDGYTLLGGALAIEPDIGTVSVSGDTTVTIASGIEDGAGVSRDLRKVGTGTLVLTGNNRYSGNTIVEAGTLAGTAASIRGNLANAGTVVFDQSHTADFSGQISDHGSAKGVMVKRGAGSLTLSGASALDWRIETGGLVSASDRFIGDLSVAAGASMTFRQDQAGTYDGRITGAGNLMFAGGGTVRLDGKTDMFTGKTVIRDKIVVMDKRHGGTLSVLKNGTLQGSGVVGSTTVSSQGTIAPGLSIGTLKINGDIVFQPGSQFAVEVDPDGRGADRLAATGIAKLGGGSVLLARGDGTFDPLSTYTILTAKGGIRGRFAKLISDFAFLDPRLSYGATTVSLTLARNGKDFSAVGNTPNQRATGAAIEALGAGARLHDVVLPLGAAGARNAFDLLSGDIHASTMTALIAGSQHLRETILARMASSDQAGAGSRKRQPAERVTAWSQGVKADGRHNGDGNAAGFDRNSGAAFVGGDIRLSPDLSLGLFTGHGTSAFRFDDRNASVRSTDKSAGVYAIASFGPTSLRMGASKAWHDITSHRNVAFTGFSDRLKGEHAAQTTQVFAELGHTILLAQATLQPFIGLDYTDLKANGLNETGGAAALSVGAGRFNAFSWTVGTHMSADITLDNRPVTLSGLIGWQHVPKKATPDLSMAFADGNMFEISGVPLVEDRLVLDLGLSTVVGKKTTVNLAYKGRFGGGTADNAAQIGIAIRF